MEEQIKQALEVLRRGGIILYPTDTIWGIGCDATNAEAVRRIYDLKKRDDRKSMIVLADNEAMVERYVQEVPAVAWELWEVSDKPLTLILPEGRGLAENLMPAEGTIAMRIVRNEFCRRLTGKLGRPLVSTSANLSGETSPTTYDQIAPLIREGVDLAVDPAMEEKGATHQASAIIQLGPGGEFKIIRD